MKPKKIEKKTHDLSVKYDHKWDNVNFEQGLESKRKALDEKISELKIVIRDLYNILSILKKEKEEMEFSNDILDNFAKYNHDEEKIMKKMSTIGKRMDKLTENEFEKISHYKRLMDVEKYLLYLFNLF